MNSVGDGERVFTKVVFLLLLLIELGRGDIHGNLDFAGISRSLNGIGDEVKSLLRSLDIRSDLDRSMYYSPMR